MIKKHVLSLSLKMLPDRMIKSQMLKCLKVNFPTHIALCDQEMCYTHGTSFMCRAFGTYVVLTVRATR